MFAKHKRRIDAEIIFITDLIIVCSDFVTISVIN